MTLGGFRTKSEKGGRFTTRSAVRSAPVAEEPIALTAYIDQGVEFSGKLRSKGSVRIDGRIKGEIKVGQTVIIGEAANVQAKIDADTAIVSGEVRGDIIARKKITLDKNARVTGNLSTPGIVIEEGACLRGQIVIGADEDEIARPAKSDKASAPTGGARRRGAVTPAPQL